MMPINFKYKKPNLEELQVRISKNQGRYNYDLPSSKSQQNITVNRTPFTVRFQQEQNSNWIARRATEEVKEKHDYVQKRINLIQVNEQKLLGKQELIDKKMQYLDFVRQRKSRDQELKLKEEYYERQMQIQMSTRNLREQLSVDLKKAKEQLQQQKKMENQEIIKIKQENSQIIKEINDVMIYQKRQITDKIRLDKEFSFQSKCRFFNEKQINQQIINIEKRKDQEKQQGWLLNEISQLEQEEYRARQRYNSLQVNRMEKENLMNSFMGITKPTFKGSFSTKNSQENSPASSSYKKHSGSEKKFYFHS